MRVVRDHRLPGRLGQRIVWWTFGDAVAPPRKDSYEAVVVGSGFGGAVAACRLAQAGIAVAVVERGRRFGYGGFPRPARGRIDRMLWHEGGPYDVKALNDIVVVQAAGYGGGSLIYANVQMRPPADLFDDGWPHGLTRSTLDPYYDVPWPPAPSYAPSMPRDKHEAAA